MPSDREETLERLADLTLTLGANLQPDQILTVTAELEHAPLVRAIADLGYRRGARFVDVYWFDPYVKRARIEYADASTLDFVPSWYAERALAKGEQRCAGVTLTGPTDPHAFDDLDPARAGRDVLPRVKESGQVVNDRTSNWTIVPYPTRGWASLVRPNMDADEAFERLWDDIVHVCRLDEIDPIAAWQARIDATATASARLNERRFDAVHFEGPGTDLTIGLFPSSVWANALFRTVDGIDHLANIPTEEVFTSPDPLRADGVVRSTKPLVFPDGARVTGLTVRFEGGVAVSIDADEGGENLRARSGKDPGAARLGEVALVDREGRIGKLDTIFHDTLLDENAASHLALGKGFGFAVESEDDCARVNDSAVHHDFMIGADDVDVTGITRDGERVPVLRGGAWQI
jgi:aminopeptidase